MYAAYDVLSDGLKATLDGLRALHSSRHVFGAEADARRGDLKDRIGNPRACDTGRYPPQGSFEPLVIDDGVATEAEVEALEAYFDTRLEDEYPGWELNEGSTGEYVIELGTDDFEVLQEHTTRHSETDVLRHTLAGAAASAPPAS